MAVNLSKGQKINLSKEITELANVTVGLGWDASKSGASIDCDSSVFVLRKTEKKKSFFKNLLHSGETDTYAIKNGDDIVYYGHKRHESGCIMHRGDNLVGGTGKRGDDEQIAVNLKSMPSDIKKLVVVVNIYNCVSKHQHFGMIQNCYARIVDDATKKEICRYNLTDDYSGKTALILGELFRDENDEWHFKAVGEGTRDTSISMISGRYS